MSTGSAAYNFSAWLIAGLVLAISVDGKEARHA
jgi:hypothetical protein